MYKNAGLHVHQALPGCHDTYQMAKEAAKITTLENKPIQLAVLPKVKVMRIRNKTTIAKEHGVITVRALPHVGMVSKHVHTM